MPPRPSRPARRSGKKNPHRRHQPGNTRPAPPLTRKKHNALAFNTLLSSQEPDAHHQQPTDRLRGNPANLPYQLKTVKSASPSSPLIGIYYDTLPYITFGLDTRRFCREAQPAERRPACSPSSDSRPLAARSPTRAALIYLHGEHDRPPALAAGVGASSPGSSRTAVISLHRGK